MTATSIASTRRAPVVAAARVASPASTASRRPAIPASARVAVIGDSHTAGVFGDSLKHRLQRYLHDGGGKLLRFTGIPSSSVSNFLHGTPTRAGTQTFQTPKLSDVLAAKPDVLVVALGTNMLFGSRESNATEIRKLLAKADAAGTRVVWVGPPDVHGFGGNLAGSAPERRFYAALHEVAAERAAAGKPALRIINSRPSTREQDTFDGVHFQGHAATAWAHQVFRDATGR